MPDKRTAKNHQTTIRFSDEMWEALERAAGQRDVSIAQYVRDAARERLDKERLAADRESLLIETLAADRDGGIRGIDEKATALWEEGRMARERAQRLRAQSREQRQGTGASRQVSIDRSEGAAALWEKGRLARERAQMLRDQARSAARNGPLPSVARETPPVEDAPRVVRRSVD